MPIAELLSLIRALIEPNFSTAFILRSNSPARRLSKVKIVSSFISLIPIKNFEAAMSSAPFSSPRGTEYCLGSIGSRANFCVFSNQLADH